MNPTPATVAIPGYLAGIWKADPLHCEIGFSARQLMVGKVRRFLRGGDVSDDELPLHRHTPDRRRLDHRR